MKIFVILAVTIFGLFLSSCEAQMCDACRSSSNCYSGYKCLGRRGDPYGRCYAGYEGIPCTAERQCALGLDCEYNSNYGRRVCSPAPKRCSANFQCNGLCANGICTIGFPGQYCRINSHCMTGRCSRNRCTGCPSFRHEVESEMGNTTAVEIEDIDGTFEMLAEISAEPELDVSAEPELDN